VPHFFWQALPTIVVMVANLIVVTKEIKRREAIAKKINIVVKRKK
jgi:hypothetical protein